MLHYTKSSLKRAREIEAFFETGKSEIEADIAEAVDKAANAEGLVIEVDRKAEEALTKAEQTADTASVALTTAEQASANFNTQLVSLAKMQASIDSASESMAALTSAFEVTG